MIRTVVLPSAIDGIVTGCILSIGRIVGESAALLFTAGMANEVISFLSAPLPNKAGSTLTVACICTQRSAAILTLRLRLPQYFLYSLL